MNEAVMGVEPVAGHPARSRGSFRAAAARVLREPFLHFLVLGAGLFLFNHHLEESARYTRITITADQVKGIATNYRLQYGNAPSSQQLGALVDSFIREEVFYHEALKLGLDRDDEIIRRRLVQKYEFLQQDLAIAHDPAETDLRAFYAQHAERYVEPERVSFTQVYFSPDLRGEEGAHAAAQQLALELSGRGPEHASERGDRFPGAYDYAARSRDELGRAFGREGLAEQIFGVAPGSWSGPLRSGLGWHVVYLSEQQAPRALGFEEARADVARDYLEAARTARNDATFAKLRRSFVVVRE